MPDTTSSLTASEIFYPAPGQLIEHPHLAALPPLDERSAELLDFERQVRDAGVILSPVLVDEHDRLIEGRRRRHVAQKLGLSLPARRCDSRDAALIVLQSLSANRRYNKGAVAYLAAPLLETYIEESKARRHRNLLQNRETAFNAVSVETLETLAEKLGFGERLLRYARTVHKIFAENIDARAKYEARILSGELNIAKVEGGEIGAAAGEAGKTAPIPKWERMLRRGLTSLKGGFDHWEKAAPAQRMEFARVAAAEVAATWPEDVQRAVLSELERRINRGPAPKF